MDFYVGLSLAANSSIDTGVAVLDEKNNLITVDKLYKMEDIAFFFDNFTSLKQSHVCVSLPWDKTMLEGKWRIFGKPYQLVMSNENIPNRENWTQRYSNRGSDCLKNLETLSTTRFELYLTRQSMKLNSGFRERSPADCKFLQQALKIEHGFDLPSNMMPMSQLEAIVGAILAREYSKNKTKTIGQFKELEIIDIISS
jgi:hypothetical protein